MPGATFRLARPRDAWAIALMSRELIEGGLSGWSWPPPRVARSIQARDTVVLVTSITDLLVGFAIMNFGDVQAHLSLLAVRPSHRRRGIGRRMMAWLEESALVAGIATVNLELRVNNSAARDFYRALGFKDAAYIPGYYQGVETALRMTRDLRRPVSGRIN